MITAYIKCSALLNVVSEIHYILETTLVDLNNKVPGIDMKIILEQQYLLINMCLKKYKTIMYFIKL